MHAVLRKRYKFFPLIFLLIILPAVGFILGIYYANYLSNKKALSTQNSSMIGNATDTSNLQIITGDNQSNPQEENIIATGSANVYFHGPRDKKKIALTFDAEMTQGMKQNYLSGRTKSSYDKRIVDTLLQTHTKTTFFLTGLWIELYPDITLQLAKNPLFEIGSHSFTDSSFSGYCYGLTPLTENQSIEEVGATELLLQVYAGVKNKLFRFPGGCFSQHNLEMIQLANNIVINWDVAGNDGFTNDTQSIINNVLHNVQNGSIILLHLNGAPTSPKTADALPTIIAELKRKEYEFVKISELLSLPTENHIIY